MAALLVLAIIDLGWRRAFSAFVVALGVGLIVTGLLAVDWSYVSHHYSGHAGVAIVLAVVAGCVVIGRAGDSFWGRPSVAGPATCRR